MSSGGDHPRGRAVCRIASQLRWWFLRRIAPQAAGCHLFRSKLSRVKIPTIWCPRVKFFAFQCDPAHNTEREQRPFLPPLIPSTQMNVGAFRQNSRSWLQTCVQWLQKFQMGLRNIMLLVFFVWPCWRLVSARTARRVDSAQLQRPGVGAEAPRSCRPLVLLRLSLPISAWFIYSNLGGIPSVIQSLILYCPLYWIIRILSERAVSVITPRNIHFCFPDSHTKRRCYVAKCRLMGLLNGVISSVVWATRWTGDHLVSTQVIMQTCDFFPSTAWQRFLCFPSVSPSSQEASNHSQIKRERCMFGKNMDQSCPSKNIPLRHILEKKATNGHVQCSVTISFRATWFAAPEGFVCDAFSRMHDISFCCPDLFLQGWNCWCDQLFQRDHKWSSACCRPSTSSSPCVLLCSGCLLLRTVLSQSHNVTSNCRMCFDNHTSSPIFWWDDDQEWC